MIGLPELIAAVIAIALNAAVLTGGADFGGGVWTCSRPARGEASERLPNQCAHLGSQSRVADHRGRPAVHRLPGRVQCARHGAAHPITISCSASCCAIPFVFALRHSRPQPAALGHRLRYRDIVTPVLLGIIVGSIARAAADAAARIGVGGFWNVFVSPWAAAFPVAVGLLAVALFAFLAATYLTVDAEDDALRDDFRARALGAALAVFACAAAALALAHSAAPRVAVAVIGALVIQIATAVTALTAIAALWRRRYRLARAAAAQGAHRGIRRAVSASDPAGPQIRAAAPQPFACSPLDSQAARSSCCRRCAICSERSSSRKKKGRPEGRPLLSTYFFNFSTCQLFHFERVASRARASRCAACHALRTADPR
jgi:cytochrome d ubiquinol oxidase subunit II